MKINPVMAMAHSWGNRDLVQEFLATQLLHGRLALVLGAGVSVPFGLPNWDTLIERMYQSKGASRDSSMTLPLQAEVFRLTHCKDWTDYLHTVSKALYEGVNIDFWTLKPLLAAIGALVMASKRGSASTIITFNFDDVLESYLEFHGFVATSVLSGRHWADGADVRIYHPHGFLPLRPGISTSPEIVLDQTSYGKALGDKMWREVLLSTMRSHFCLFVGLSGSDLNLESFLQECRSDHASYGDGLSLWGLRFTDLNSPSWQTIWRERGVATWQVSNYDRDLPAFLLEICQKAARQRSKAS